MVNYIYGLPHYPNTAIISVLCTYCTQHHMMVQVHCIFPELLSEFLALKGSY